MSVHRPSPSELDAVLGERDAQRLQEACPALDDWPSRWQSDPADVAAGRQIVLAIKPFLLDLLDQGLAARTVRRHRDNLWLLGGELIRRRYDEDILRGMDASAALRKLVGADGGPLVWPRLSEAEQDSLDATCRKLHRFFQTSGNGQGGSDLPRRRTA